MNGHMDICVELLLLYIAGYFPYNAGVFPGPDITGA